MPLPEIMDVAAQQYCLRWNYHHSNLQAMFAQLLERESFCDVTLACEGKTLRANKMMLAAGSTYFDTIFSSHEDKDPIVILTDVKFDDIKALVEFTYKGEITVKNSQLKTLLQTAEELRIKGLAGIAWQSEEGEGFLRTVNSQQVINDEQKTDEDSQEPMRDTRTHSVVYTEYENVQSQVGNPIDTTQNNLCIPSVIEGEGNLKTERSVSGVPPRTATCVTTTSGSGSSGGSLGGFGRRGRPGFFHSALNAAQMKPELQNVRQMKAYIQQGGRRDHFWKISSTKRVMDAIKNKIITASVAAELLGVCRATVYRRYRDAYGRLKQPSRAWGMGHELEVIKRMENQELSLSEAAKKVKMTQTSLANFVASLNDLIDEVVVEND